jgi:hypothetical protein
MDARGFARHAGRGPDDDLKCIILAPMGLDPGVSAIRVRPQGTSAAATPDFATLHPGYIVAPSPDCPGPTRRRISRRRPAP